MTADLLAAIRYLAAEEVEPGRYAIIRDRTSEAYALAPIASLEHLTRCFKGRSEYDTDFDGWYEADDRIVEVSV